MSKSYGFIEITGVVAAMDALDIMCKTADVELASWERKLGGRLVTIIVQGDVAAVTEAVEAAATNAIKKPASYAVIANPHEEIVKIGRRNGVMGAAGRTTGEGRMADVDWKSQMWRKWPAWKLGDE